LVGLALAAEAAAGDEAARAKDFTALLSADRRPGRGELTLAAIHLIYYPQPDLLSKLLERWPVVLTLPNASERSEVALALLAAAGASGDRDRFTKLRDQAVSADLISHAAGQRITEGFFPNGTLPQMDRMLPSLPGLFLELNYALNDWGRRVELAKGSNRRS
jgi:hypothetical protein